MLTSVGESASHEPTEDPGHWSQQIHCLTGSDLGTEPTLKIQKIHQDAPWYRPNMSSDTLKSDKFSQTRKLKQPSLQLNLLATNNPDFLRLCTTFCNCLQLRTIIFCNWLDKNSKTRFSVVVSWIHLNSTTKPWPPGRDVVISKR